ncbi:RNA methyltransferase [Candidatus Acetothermia bacterium]|nr:RNA methyltransferase [Candidatus Acetothermia bacterium]
MRLGADRIKRLRRLSRCEGWQESGLLLVEGTRVVDELLASNWQVETIFALSAEEWAPRAARHNAEFIEIDAQTARRLASSVSPPGVFAVAAIRTHTIEEIVQPGNAFLLLLDAVQDPGNVGTLIRTAWAMGVTGVILGPGTAHRLSPKVLRAAAGSLFHIPVVEVNDLVGLVGSLRQTGFTCCAAEPRNGVPIEKINVTRPLALVLGNEGAGLDRAVVALCNKRITILLCNQAESLSVAVSGGILLHLLRNSERVRSS